MMKNQRTFIEAATHDTLEAKERLLPLLMIRHPEAPWTTTAIESLRDTMPSLDPLMQGAVGLILAFELPFVREEERLAHEGVTLESDMSAFEVTMVEFERAFWEARYADYQRNPARYSLRVRPHFDVCHKHQLDSDRVRHAIRDHAASSFEEIAPILGTSDNCSHCKLGVTRLITQEIRRSKGVSA